MSFRYPVVMPKMSMTMETGELIGYHVQVGDRVKSGQLLFEVMTDKIDMEVEAPADGVIEELIGAEGAVIEIGKPVLIMQTDTEVMSFDFDGMGDVPAQTPQEVEAPLEVAPAIAATPTASIRAVPKARAIAADRGIDLHSIAPTGPDQTITLSDVGGNRLSDDQLRRQAANKALIARGLEITRSLPQTSFSRATDKSPSLAELIAKWAKVLRGRPDLHPGEIIGVAAIIESKYGSALPVFKNPDLQAADELNELVSTTVSVASKGKVPLAMLNGATTTLFDLGRYQMSSQVPPLFPNQITSLAIGQSVISLTIDLRHLDFYDGAALLDALIALL